MQLANPIKCKDCKDGYYYPLVGSPEPCQTCSKPSECFIQDVADLFTEKLFLYIEPMVKTYRRSFLEFPYCADLNFPLGYNFSTLIAIKAAQMLEGHLKGDFIEKIAFENVFSLAIPNDTKDTKYVRSEHNGVSAVVSMKKTDDEMQFQFQIKVIT